MTDKPDLTKPMRERFEAAKAAWEGLRKTEGGRMIDGLFGESMSVIVQPKISVPETDDPNEPVPPQVRYSFYRGKAMMLHPFWGWLKCEAIVTHNNQMVEQLGDWEKAT